MTTRKLVKGIIPSKNNPLFLTVITADGSTYPLAKAFLAALQANGSSTEMVEISSIKAGDLIYGKDKITGEPVPAPRNSTKKDKEGNPFYLVGEFPTWREDGWKVTGFTSADMHIADLKIKALELQLAKAGM